MDKLYFQAVVELFAKYRVHREKLDVVRTPKTPELAPLVTVFENNYSRLEAISRLPQSMIGIGIAVKGAFAAASLEVTGKIEPGKVDQETEDTISSKFKEYLRVESSSTYSVTKNILDTILDGDTDITITAFQTIFHNLLIGSWTAVETLLTDIWVAAVNLRPLTLGLKALKSQKRRKDSDEDTGESGKAKPQTISVDMLVKYRFNLESRIGYFHWRERKFDFNSLDGLRHAYKTVFGEDWFENKHFEDVSILEALRHVLVHRGGLVDEAFQDRVKNHPEFSKLDVEYPLEVDGRVVVRYVHAGALFASLLLNKVDEFLQKNLA